MDPQRRRADVAGPLDAAPDERLADSGSLHPRAHCERVFLRLKQFKLAEGVTAEEIDSTRDQIVRACLEKASVGTVACFLASRSYAEARRCR